MKRFTKLIILASLFVFLFVSASVFSSTAQAIIFKPDLIIQSITPSKTNPIPGETINIDVVVKNQNTFWANAGGFRVDLYDNPISAPPTQGQPGVTFQWVPSLASGDSALLTFTRSWGSIGSHNIWAQADTFNDVSETNELNNVLGPVNVNVVNKPDLIIQSITPSKTNPNIGEVININVVVKNQGTAAAAGAFWVVLYDNPAPAPPGLGQTGVAKQGVSGLASGASVTRTFTRSWGSPGSHNIWAQADTPSYISESNEGNNVLGPVNVTVLNQSPVAVIDSITPNPAAPGQNVAFSGHGTDNDGTIAAYSWRSSIDGPLSTSTSFSNSNLSVGTHTIYFKVQDDNGAWSPEASTTLSITSPPPLAILSTLLKLSVKPKVVKQGKAVTIAVRLRDINGNPVARKTIIIKANGKIIKAIVTNSGGTFSFKHKPKKTTTYKAYFAGSGNYGATTSNSVKVVVKKRKRR